MLESVGTDLWSYRFPMKAAGLPLGGRTTVARLGDGSLFIHSPGPLDEAGAAEIAALGSVRALVAPNNMHHLHVAAHARYFPEARRYGTAGLEKKGVAVDEVLGPQAPAAWGGEVEQIALAGVPFTDEVVFFHRASGTLMLADLCFNLRGVEGWLSRLGLRLNDALERFGPSRLTRSTIKDRQAMAEALDRMLDWPIEQITVCHGEVLRGDARGTLREAFSWL